MKGRSNLFIKKRGSFAVVSALFLITHWVSPAIGGDAVDIGKRLELFIDDHLVDKTEGDVSRHLVRPSQTILVSFVPFHSNSPRFGLVQ